MSNDVAPVDLNDPSVLKEWAIALQVDDSQVLAAAAKHTHAVCDLVPLQEQVAPVEDGLHCGRTSKIRSHQVAATQEARRYAQRQLITCD